jgi:predicted CopG family antitoxin
MKTARSITLDADVVAAVERTKNGRSVSDRVNELVKRGLRAEKYEQLAREAAEFFRKPNPDERAERKAFSKASKRALSRD